MSKKTMPPVPPEQRSRKGPGAAGARNEVADTAMAGNRPEGNRNPGKLDRADMQKNTTHQGYQQDR